MRERLRLSVALLVLAAAGCGGAARAGGPAAAERAGAHAQPDAARGEADWVLVEAPSWSSGVARGLLFVDGDDVCFATGSVRACNRQNAWRDVAFGTEHRIVAFAGHVGDEWLFEDDAARVWAARGFTGVLREASPTDPTRALGDPLQAPARLTVDGTLLAWQGSAFVPIAFGGRVYDAAFLTGGGGIVLSEPGEVSLSDSGEVWTLVPHAGPPPRSLAELDPASLPARFAPLLERARALAGLTNGIERDEARRAPWVTRLVQRFGRRDGPSLPDLLPQLLPELREPLAELGIFAPPDFDSNVQAKPLARGWLVRGRRGADDREVFLHVDVDLTARALPEGPAGLLLASQDGRATLVFGTPCPGDVPSTPSLANACFTDPTGAYSVQLPPDVNCAQVHALGAGQLLVGGDDCPAAVCGRHPFVRFELRRGDGPLTAIPVPVEGAALVYAPLTDELDRRDCVMYEAYNSPAIPDGDAVRLVVRGETGAQLLVGPLAGPLHAHPLPDEGAVAFADARHGVFVSSERAWTTSDGGLRWDPIPGGPTPIPAGPLRAVDSPSCSADACRVGDRYWMAPRVASSSGFARTNVLGAALPLRSPRRTTSAAEQRWRQAAPTRPSLAPTLLPLRLSRPWTWPGHVSAVVGGVVETNPFATINVRWSGVTLAGRPFDVATHARDGDAPGEWLDIGEYVVVAMTDRFVALLCSVTTPVGGTARSVGLVVVHPDGHTTRHASPLPPLDPMQEQVIASWPLPLSDGGLGAYVLVDGRRWLLRFDAAGNITTQRVLEGLPYARDEMIAWYQGELGLVAGTRGDSARFYTVSGSQRDIPAPRTPEGPCSGRGSPTASRFASSWGDAGAWTLSEEQGGPACVRAASTTWAPDSSPAVRQGSHFVAASEGSFRGWFVSPLGSVADASIVAAQQAPCRAGCDAAVRPPSFRVELEETSTGLLIWIPVGSDSLNGLYPYAWDTGAFAESSPASPPRTLERQYLPHLGISREPRDAAIALRPGVLVSSHDAYPIVQGAAPPHTAVSAGDELFVDAVASERGIVWAVEQSDASLRVDWPAERGEPGRGVIARPTSERWWRRARLSNDARALVELVMRWPRGSETVSVGELRIHRLGATGVLTSDPPFQVPLQQLGAVEELSVATARGVLVVATSGPQSIPITVFGTSRAGTLRQLGHPISTSQCGADVLAVGAEPPRVVWTDCALATDQRFLRVAELRGGRWQEVLPARPLGASGEVVGAVVTHAQGTYVAYVDNDALVLMTLRRHQWDEVARTSR